MIFKRKVYAKLIEWKTLAAGTSAVLLEGARRIGKSTIVEEFAKKEYDDYMILDFARENHAPNVSPVILSVSSILAVSIMIG